MKKSYIAFVSLLFTLVFAPPGRAGLQEDDQDDLQKKANDYRKHVTEIRGLQFKNEVKVGVYSKKELTDFITEEFEKELPRDKAKKYEKAYAHFGLIPKDMDLFDSLIDLYGSSIAGFYHPKTKQMRLIRSSGGLLNLEEDMTLVHELTHAAQDQNFDLNTLPLEDETNDDMVMAMKGLIEGDASVVGYKYAFKGTFDTVIGMINSQFKNGMLPGKAGKLPKYLRLTLTFPYGYGAEWVLAIKKAANDDFAGISKAFEDLPSSTSQILHPEKYYGKRVNPIIITFPDIAKMMGEGWSLLVNNVHGEYVMRILLGEFKGNGLTAKSIEKVCEGWRGDRFHVLEKGDQVSSVWMTTWESEEAAKKFFEAYRTALGKKHEDSEEVKSDDGLLLLKKDDVSMFLSRAGQDVLVIEGSADLLPKAEAIWKGTTQKELKKIERVQPKEEKKKKRDYQVLSR